MMKTKQHNKVLVGIFNLLGSMSLLFVPTYVAADDLTHCVNRFHQTKSLCQCAVERGQQVFVDKQQAQQDRQINQKDAAFNKRQQQLLADPNLTEERIDIVCDRFNEQYVYEESLPQNERAKRVDSRQMSKQEIQTLTLKRREAAKDVHNLLDKFAASTKSYQTLFSQSGFCKGRYDLAKMKKEAPIIDKSTIGRLDNRTIYAGLKECGM